ncbi:Urea active transporter [Venturia nashicola]|nr:Urea active transporter [Venturia nashicola]
MATKEQGTNLFEAGKKTSYQPSAPPSQLFRVCKQLFYETSVLSCRKVTAVCFDNAYVMNRYLKEGEMSLEQRKAIRLLFCQYMSCKTTLKKFNDLREIIQRTEPKGFGEAGGLIRSAVSPRIVVTEERSLNKTPELDRAILSVHTGQIGGNTIMTVAPELTRC